MLSDSTQTKGLSRRVLLYPPTKPSSGISSCLNSSLIVLEDEFANSNIATPMMSSSSSLEDASSSPSAPSSPYHDFSSAPDIEIPCKTKGGVKLPFPVKLFLLLEHIDLYEPELASIISWQPHGRCFLTHDIKRMEGYNVLSRFFRQKNYSSFRRQLNLWGFKRVIHGPDQGAYYHELFLRGKPYLCRSIERLAPRKPNGTPFNSEEEIEPPKFHTMPVLPPSFPFVQITFAEFSQEDTNEQNPMMMCTAKSEYGHSHNAAPAATINLVDSPSSSHSVFAMATSAQFLPANAPTKVTLLPGSSSIATFDRQCDDSLDQEEQKDITKWCNLTVYPIGNSPPATDQEMSDIMIFLKKLSQVEDEDESVQFCEGL